MTTRTEAPAAMKAFSEAFEKLTAQKAFGDLPIRSLRQRAFAQFRESGFPTARQEEWRFTNVAPIAKTPFRIDHGPQVEETEVDPSVLQVSSGDACSITFVNGVWSPLRSNLDGLPAGLGVRRLLQANTNATGKSFDRLGIVTDMESNPFAALNTSLFHDGVVITVPEGVVVDSPVYVVLISTTDNDPSPRAVFPRLLVIAGRHSALSIVEVYQGNGSGLTNAVAEFYLEEGSKVEHDRIQIESLRQFHINTMTVRQERGSVFTSNAMTFGGALVRNGIHVTLAGPGAECTLNGLSIAKGTQHIDNHTSIDHAAEQCTSHELYKTILDDSAHGVFNGKIFVRPGGPEDRRKADEQNRPAVGQRPDEHQAAA